MVKMSKRIHVGGDSFELNESYEATPYMNLRVGKHLRADPDRGLYVKGKQTGRYHFIFAWNFASIEEEEEVICEEVVLI